MTTTASPSMLVRTLRGIPKPSANVTLAIGSGILFVLVLLGAVAPLLLPNPNAITPGSSLLPPSLEHLFGTDRYGRDVLARTVAAIRLDLLLGVGIAVAAMVIGSLLGAVAGYLGGIVDEVVMRITDAVLAFPGFLLALIVVTFAGSDVFIIALGVTIGSMPHFIRLARARALSERELDYVPAARLAGARNGRIITGHILPNTIAAPLVQTTVTAGWAILDIAGLSFLGVGIQPPTAEWGTMIAEGYSDILLGHWWGAFFPGLFMLAAVLSLQLIGDGLTRGGRR